MATFNVTNLQDSGAGSLRQALADANTIFGVDTVTFDDSLTGQTILLTTGELDITDDLTIDGDLNDDGIPDITVQRDANAPDFRIFNIDDGDIANDKVITLEGLIITGGRVTFESNDDGGGIQNHESLLIKDSAIIHNSSIGPRQYYSSPLGGKGGGIWNYGHLTLISSIVSNNLAEGTYPRGGGIWNKGRLKIQNSTVSGNSIQAFSGTRESFGNGGGIYSTDGTVTIEKSLIIDNHALNSYYGGGIYNKNGNLTVESTTISGNTTFGRRARGGGIFHYQGGNLIVDGSTISGNYAFYDGGGIHTEASTTIQNSTISGNSTGNGGGITIWNRDSNTLAIRNSTITRNTARYSGGGIYYGGSSILEVSSSIISGNKALYYAGDSDFSGRSFFTTTAVNSLGNNLVGTGQAISAFNQPGDITGITDPGLESLADNGGPTQTHALRPDSLAIDAGSNPDKLATDQRGLGFSRVINGQADIGAFEVQTLIDPINIGLYDADTNNLITELQGNEEILASTIAGRSLTIAASVPTNSPLADRVESIFLNFNNGQITQTENIEPYALFGDSNGDYNGSSLPVGSNTIELSLYSQNRLQGDFLGAINRSFKIIDDISGEPSDLSVGLFDADTDTLITTVQNGDQILVSELAGKSLTLAAFIPDGSIFSDQVESILFNLNNGQVTQTENVEPYALFGDNQGDYNGGIIPVGHNTITFDLYSQNKLQGDLLGTISRSFTIVDDVA